MGPQAVIEPVTAATDLTVVIVSYRTREDVRNCLASLFDGGGLRGVKAEVILVDNASGDGTVEMVRKSFPDVCLIENTENPGFARANNQGIARAAGRNVLLLNPDTLVPGDALAACVEFLDAQNAHVAGMTCRVESPDGSLQWACARRLVTPWCECSRALLLDRLFPRSTFFNPEPMPGWDRAESRPVECLLGAFMLLRREALTTIGGLDESFFLMYEDTDWCRRAADAGYQLLFWPGTRITHIGGQSWQQDPVRVFSASQASMLRYFGKHHPRALPYVRAFHRVGMEIKIGLLRLNQLRKPNDGYTVKHLQMARAARQTLKAAGKA